MRKYLFVIATLSVLACATRPQSTTAPVATVPVDTLIDFKNLRDPMVRHGILRKLEANYVVLDGLLIAPDNHHFGDGKIVRTVDLQDSVELAQLGVAHPTKSYKILYTEPTEFYRYAYLKVRSAIPLRLLDLQFPLLIDGRVVPLSESGVVDRLDRNAIRKIEFLDKRAPEISGDSTVVFGAIKIIL